MMKNGILRKIIRSAAAVVSAALMCVSMAGCSVEFGTSPSANDKKTAAKPTGGENTKGMEITYLDFRKQYSYFLEINDIEDDTAEEYADICTEQRNEIIDSLISTKIIIREAENAGLALTEDEISEAKANTDEQIDSIIESFGNNADFSDSDSEEITDEMRRARGEEEFNKLLEDCDITRDDLYIWTEEYLLATKLVDEVTKDITREQAKAKVDEFTDKIKEIYEEATLTYEQNGYYEMWVPEGSRLIKQVLIGFDDSVQVLISAYRSNGDDETADKIREDAAKELEEKAAEVQEKLDEMDEGKITFNEIILEYSADSASSSAYPDGYVVVPNGEYYAKEFQEAAFVPEKIGDRTVCVSDEGIHILIYAGDAEANADFIEAFVDNAYGNLKNETFQAKLEEWRTLYSYEIDRELLRLDFKLETSDASGEPDSSSSSSDPT